MPSSNTSGTTSTSLRVWQLAWPTILSNLLFTTVGFLHIKIVADLGTSSVAAVTTGHRVFFLVQAILMGMSVAATALIARNWGAKNIPRAELVTWTAMALAIGLAFVLSLPIVLAPSFVAGLFGLDPETTAQAAGFIFWLGLFNVFSAINLMLAAALRATGDVITPLCFLFFSSLLNVLFSYFFAYGIGPLPGMGVSGVALGGSLAAALITSLFAFMWWRGGFALKALKHATLDRGSARQLISIGAPSALEQGLVQIAFLVFFAIVAQYGTIPYAAYGIGSSLVAFSIVIGFGFGIAAATLVGQQLGAGNPEGAVLAGWRGLRMALIAMCLFSILMALFAEQLALFIIDEPEVVRLTVHFIYIIALTQPLMAVEFTIAGALRGAGDTRAPLYVTLCGVVFGRLLPALLFLSLSLPVQWVFSALAIDYLIKAVLLIRRYQSRKWLVLDLGTQST